MDGFRAIEEKTMTEPVICLGECLVDRLFEVGETPEAGSTNGTDYPVERPPMWLLRSQNSAPPPS
jgi:hypothetical protein